MAFISSGYNPAKPMEGRITDIGPHKYDEYFPPVIKKNFGKWLYHEILEPGVLMHVAEGGDKVYTVRVGGTRTMSITHIRELCDIADKYCGGYLRWTTRSNIEFMVEDEDTMKALRDFLRPEFLNRVDEIVCFNHLTKENFSGIARIMLDELKTSLREKGFAFRYDDALVDYLVEKSYSMTYGARNLRRQIQKELEDPMAARIIDSFENPITQISATAADGAVQLYTL